MQTAFIFPGQGSQFVGMLNELADQYMEVEAVFADVSDQLGYDLWQLVQSGPIEKLNQTQFTQVAMLAADIAVFRVLQKINNTLPKWMAGHSLGEYAALVAAGAIDLKSAASIVSERARLMQASIPLGSGAMAAIVGLSDIQVKAICVQASEGNAREVVEPANFNAIGQVVIAGHTPAVERAIALAEAQQARLAKLIPVSVPCHCSLLKPASEEFINILQEATWKSPQCAVINNVNVSVYQTQDEIIETLAKQLYSPVRWVETIQEMKKNGLDRVIECGPGKVLGGLVKRIDKSIEVVNDPFAK